MVKKSIGIALLLAGCASLDIFTPTAWQGSLTPTTAELITGSVAAASMNQNSFDAGINVIGSPETRYGWQIHNGSCAQRGSPLGGRASYPDFETSADGIGIVERTPVTGVLRAGSRYHAVVLQADDRSVVLACGDLTRQEF